MATNVSNTALRLSNTNREIQPRSDYKSKSFLTLMRAVSVLWYGLAKKNHSFG